MVCIVYSVEMTNHNTHARARAHRRTRRTRMQRTHHARTTHTRYLRDSKMTFSFFWANIKYKVVNSSQFDI